MPSSVHLAARRMASISSPLFCSQPSSFCWRAVISWSFAESSRSWRTASWAALRSSSACRIRLKSAKRRSSSVLNSSVLTWLRRAAKSASSTVMTLPHLGHLISFICLRSLHYRPPNIRKNTGSAKAPGIRPAGSSSNEPLSEDAKQPRSTGSEAVVSRVIPDLIGDPA